MASLSLGLASGSPPPSLAAIEIYFISFVNSLPLLASAAPFFLFIVDHLLCPDIIESNLVMNKINSFHMNNSIIMDTYNELNL